MISESAVFWGINIFALIGIILFFVKAFMANFSDKNKCLSDPLDDDEKKKNKDNRSPGDRYEEDE